jgi:hypothetical protein
MIFGVGVGVVERPGLSSAGEATQVWPKVVLIGWKFLFHVACCCW